MLRTKTTDFGDSVEVVVTLKMECSRFIDKKYDTPEVRQEVAGELATIAMSQIYLDIHEAALQCRREVLQGMGIGDNYQQISEAFESLLKLTNTGTFTPPPTVPQSR
jgi:hypothetical protein